MKITVQRSSEYVKAQQIAMGRNVPECITAEIDPANLSEFSRTKIIQWWEKYPTEFGAISVTESGRLNIWSGSGGNASCIHADVEVDGVTPDLLDTHIRSIVERAEHLRSEYLAPLHAVWPTYEREGIGAFLSPAKHHAYVGDNWRDLDACDIPVTISDALHSEHPELWKQAIAERDRRQNAAVAAAQTEYANLKAAREQREAEAEAKETAIRNAWIAAHGSDRLKRLLAEDIECDAVYETERLALERPGWAYDKSTRGEANTARNSKQEGLDLLDEARKTADDAQLVWWVVEHEHSDNCDEYRDDCPKYDWKGYACTAEFLGRDIVFGVPEEYAC